MTRRDRSCAAIHGGFSAALLAVDVTLAPPVASLASCSLWRPAGLEIQRPLAFDDGGVPPPKSAGRGHPAFPPSGRPHCGTAGHPRPASERTTPIAVPLSLRAA